MRRGWLLGAVALVCGGCMLHQNSSQRLVEVANELNTAARFGQLDTAAEHTSTASRPMFMQRREAWGNDVRVLDVNLASIQMTDETHAEVIVQYAWTRMNEGTLRTTSVRQEWENPELGGWRLEREQRSAGDLGLFGEHVPTAPQTQRGDAQFATKSLGLSR